MNHRSDTQHLDSAIAQLTAGWDVNTVLATSEPHIRPYVKLFSELLAASDTMSAEPSPEFRSRLRSRFVLGARREQRLAASRPPWFQRAAIAGAASLVLGAGLNPALAAELVDHVRETIGRAAAEAVQSVLFTGEPPMAPPAPADGGDGTAPDVPSGANPQDASRGESSPAQIELEVTSPAEASAGTDAGGAEADGGQLPNNIPSGIVPTGRSWTGDLPSRAEQQPPAPASHAPGAAPASGEEHVETPPTPKGVAGQPGSGAGTGPPEGATPGHAAQDEQASPPGLSGNAVKPPAEAGEAELVDAPGRSGAPDEPMGQPSTPGADEPGGSGPPGHVAFPEGPPGPPDDSNGPPVHAAGPEGPPGKPVEPGETIPKGNGPPAHAAAHDGPPGKPVEPGGPTPKGNGPPAHAAARDGLPGKPVEAGGTTPKGNGPPVHAAAHEGPPGKPVEPGETEPKGGGPPADAGIPGGSAGKPGEAGEARPKGDGPPEHASAGAKASGKQGGHASDAPKGDGPPAQAAAVDNPQGAPGEPSDAKAKGSAPVEHTGGEKKSTGKPDEPGASKQVGPAPPDGAASQDKPTTPVSPADEPAEPDILEEDGDANGAASTDAPGNMSQAPGEKGAKQPDAKANSSAPGASKTAAGAPAAPDK